jgi:hypothetical protein
MTILEYLNALLDAGATVNRIVSPLPRPEGLDPSIAFAAPSEPTAATRFYSGEDLVGSVLHLVEEPPST